MPGRAGSAGGADAPRIQQQQRWTAVIVSGRTRRRDEHFLAFEEEGPPLTEEHLEGGQVDHHVVLLDGPEIGIQRRGQLHVGIRSPVDVGADARFQIALANVPGRGGEGIERELPARLHAGDPDRAQDGKKPGLRRRKCRHRPTLIEVRNLARDVETDAPRVFHGRHRHHGPGQEELGRPARLRLRARTAPGAVPLIAERPLRDDGAIGQGIAEADREPVAIEAGPGRVDGDGDRVPVDPGVARRQSGDQRVRVLLCEDADVETVIGVGEADLGRELGTGQRVGLDDAEIVVDGSIRPERLVETAVDAHPHLRRVVVHGANELIVIHRTGCGRGSLEPRESDEARQRKQHPSMAEREHQSPGSQATPGGIACIVTAATFVRPAARSVAQPVAQSLARSF